MSSNGSRARGFAALCEVLLGYSVLGAVAAVPSTPVHAQSFSGLGFLPGDTYSLASVVNANGSVVVGSSYTAVRGQAFRWTAAGGMVGLGYLPCYSQSYSAAVNADGSVVVGYSSQIGGEFQQAIRWTGPGGLMGLGYLSGNNQSIAFGVSADGSVVVGNSNTAFDCCTNQAFRWTAAGGMVGLGSVGLSRELRLGCKRGRLGRGRPQLCGKPQPIPSLSLDCGRRHSGSRLPAGR